MMAFRSHTLAYGLIRPVPEGVRVRIRGTNAETIRPTKVVIWYEDELSESRRPVLHFFSGRNDRAFEGVQAYADLDDAIADLPWLEEGLRKFDRVVIALQEAVRS